jgi:hypothetical protein
MDVANVHDDSENIYSPREQYQPAAYTQQQPTPPPIAYPARESVRTPEDPQLQLNDSNGRNIYSYGLDGPLQVPRSTVPRPSSAYTLGSELSPQGRTQSPRLSVGGSPNGSPNGYARQASSNRRSPDLRPTSYIDLVNLPYNQQIAPAANLGNAQLRTAVGQNASLLDTKKTLDMYRGNVKKTQDSAVQYEFALFMVQVAREIMAAGPTTDDHGLAPTDMLREARQILQKLADRSYPFAQYYLADGYASGLFNKDKPDYDRAFPLFIAARQSQATELLFATSSVGAVAKTTRKQFNSSVQRHRRITRVLRLDWEKLA